MSSLQIDSPTYNFAEVIYFIDFVTELELKSILIIKDEEDGSPVLLLNLLVKHINSLNKMVAVVNYDSR